MYRIHLLYNLLPPSPWDLSLSFKSQIDSTVQYQTIQVITQQLYDSSLILTVILDNPKICHPVTDRALHTQLKLLSILSEGYKNTDIY